MNPTEFHSHHVTTGVDSFAVNVAAGSETTVAAAGGANRRVRVYALALNAQGAADVRFESTQGGDALTGVMRMAAGTPMVWPFNPVGWFTANANELLNLEVATADVDGVIDWGYVGLA